MGDNLEKSVSEEKRKAEGGVAKGGTGECRIFLLDGNLGGLGGWVVVFRTACTQAPAKFIMDRHEKARLNYLLVEENMRLTSL